MRAWDSLRRRKWDSTHKETERPVCGFAYADAGGGED